MSFFPILFKYISILLIIWIGFLIVTKEIRKWNNTRVMKPYIKTMKQDVEILQELLTSLQQKHISKTAYSFLISEFLDLSLHSTNIKSLAMNVLEIKFPILKIIKGYSNYYSDIDVIHISQELNFRKELVKDYDNYCSGHNALLILTAPWLFLAYGFTVQFEFLFVVPYIAFTWLIIRYRFAHSYRKDIQKHIFKYKRVESTKELIEKIQQVAGYNE